MGYGDLIKDTFRITLHNRYLWFFGLFAGTGFGGSFNFNFSTGDSGRGSNATSAQDGFVPSLDAGLVIALIVAALVVLVLAIVLSVISQGALADSVAAIDRGERRGFRTAWRAGLARFWPVLGQALLIGLVSLAAVLLVVGPLIGVVVAVFLTTEAVVARVLVTIGAGLIGLAAIVLIFVPVYIVAQLALRELVLGATRVTAALRGGWQLFQRNPGRALLLFLIQQGLALGAAVVASIALVLVGVLLFLPTILLAAAGAGTAAIAAGIGAGLIVLVLALPTFGAIGTFNHGYWTLAYLRLEPLPRQPG